MSYTIYSGAASMIAVGDDEREVGHDDDALSVSAGGEGWGSHADGR